MTEVVVDASVVLKWFRAHEERHLDAARRVRRAFEAGNLAVLAPTLLPLEIMNVASRRWHWNEAALVELARALEEVGFDLREPELARVARWTARGLTSYDAAYVALAEAEAVRLITDDDLIVAASPEVATALIDATTERF